MTARPAWSRARCRVAVLTLALAASSVACSDAPASADAEAGASAATSTTAPSATARSSTHHAHAPRHPVRSSAGMTARAEARAASRGGAGIGDGYFPRYGNGGYRVRHYDVDIAFDPDTERLHGRTVVLGRATKPLSRFNLDLVLPASKVTVNGRRAVRRNTGHELVVTPRVALRRGQRMRVVVHYAGVPKAHRPGGMHPWVTTKDGAAAVGEPEIAAWWFPSNDHPSDKATFAITVRVPRGLEAISNGRLVSRRTHGRTTVWRWREDDPMATYLAFTTIGEYDIVRGHTASGRPFLYAYSAQLRNPRGAHRSVGATGAITDWLERTWGPYPYDEIGGVVLGKWIGFALENQTRPVYSRAFFEFGPNKRVVAHEMAHQWFGDRVALDRWRHIWLNEGFATYSEWLYVDHLGTSDVDSTFERRYRSHRPGSDFWSVKVAAPGRHRLFSAPVYERGAMATHALRQRIGSKDFFRLMRTWVRTSDGNGTTGAFMALAERVSGQQLDRFFRVWLFTGSRPRPTVANGFPRGF